MLKATGFMFAIVSSLVAGLGCTANVENPTVDQTGRTGNTCFSNCDSAHTTCVAKCTDDSCRASCETSHTSCAAGCTSSPDGG